jgi:hypothetical protein
MKRFFKLSLVGMIMLVLAVLTPAVMLITKKCKLDHADHVQILTACREAIGNRRFYRNDSDKWGTLEKNEVLLLRPLPKEFPQVLRDLHPDHVIVREDNILIDFNVPFARASLLGFQPGARQYGTVQYVDGLWFWNGHLGGN